MSQAPKNVDLDAWNKAADELDDKPLVAASIVDYEQEFCNHLADKDALTFFVHEGLTDDLLFSPTVKAIWRFAREEFERSHKAPTLAMLGDEFPNVEWGEPQSSAEWIAGKLRDRYKRAEVQSTLRELSKLAADPDDAYAVMRERVFEIEQAVGSRRFVYGAEDVEYFIAQYQEEVLRGFTRGFTTGFRKVDELSGGVRPGQLAFFLARPKRMKSFFLCNAAIGQALNGHDVFLDTMELSPYEMWGRISCMITGLSYDAFQKHRFTDREFDILRNAWRKFGIDYGHIHIVRPPVGQRTVAQLLQMADKLGADSLVIDQLSFLEPPKDYYARPDLATSDVVYGLKNLATWAGRERPIICAAQFNREAATLEEIADVSKAALTGAIEQVADALYGLHRTKDMKENKVIQFGLLESRGSDTGNFMVSYELKEETRFELSEVLT